MRLIVAVLAVMGAALLADEPRLIIDSGGHQATIRFVAFTRDGKYLVSAANDRVVRIWDIVSGKTVRTIQGQIGDGDEGKIYAAALSPDEHYLAVGGWLGANPDYGVIRIHDFQTGEVVALLKGHTSSVESLVFSRDGRYLASGSDDNSVRVWDVGARKSVLVLSGHQRAVYSVSFSPDGQRLVSSSLDKTLRLWDLSSGKLLKEMTGHRNEVFSAVFSPDGRYIASGSVDRTVRLWNGRTGAFIKELASPGSEVHGLSFSPDSQTLLSAGSGDYICHLFEAPSGRKLASFSGHKNIVLATAFSADGKLVATGGGSQNEIYLWDPANAKVVRELVGAGQQVWSVGFAADGKSVAFGNTWKQATENNRGPLEKTILFGANREHELGLGESVTNEASFVRARDRIADISLQLKPGEVYQTNTLQILRSGKVVHDIPLDSASGSRHNAYSSSPDGTLVASGANGFLTLYATNTGEQAASCVGHTSDVWAVAFSPDGKTLVSGSDDQTVKHWDVSPSACRNLLTVFVGADNEWVAWTPQGYYTSSANGDKYIGWHVNQGLDHQAKFYGAAQFQKQFFRPDVVAEFLTSRNIELAVKTANERRGGEQRSQPVLSSADVLASLPPMISVSSPERNEITVDQKKLRIRAEVLSNTLPIADVKVMLNGLQIAGKGDSANGGTVKRRHVELEVDLEEGPNTLSIIASNEKAMSEPETRKILYRPPGGGAVTNKQNLIALAIGISKYARPDMQLKYGDADATAFNAVLQSQVDPEHVLFGDVKVRVLPNEKATRDGIVRELDWLARQGTQRDLRVLFLSGHGDVDGRNNYFFFSHEHDPDDYDLYDVPWDLLIRKLTAVKGRALLFVDTCHAGAVTGNTRKAGGKTLSQIIKEMDTQELGMVTFAASTGSQVSVELDSFRHGAFTEALYEGLAQGKADINHDGVIETAELGEWLSQRVRELTDGKQTVVYEPTPGMPSFPIFRVKK